MRRLLSFRIAFAFFTALVLLAIAFSGLLERTEKIIHDRRIAAFPAREISPRLLVVGVTAECRDYLGDVPDRADYARLVEILDKEEAGAIVFDIFFPSPRDITQDRALIKAVAASGSVILPVFSPNPINPAHLQDRLVHPVNQVRGSFPELEQAAAGLGHINIIIDPDQVVRKAPAYISHRERIYPRLSLQALRTTRLTGVTPAVFRDPPTGRDGSFYINYLDPALLARTEFFKPLNRVLRGDFPDGYFRDRLVLVGQTIHGEKHADLVPTPLGYQFGVLVEASAMNTILTGNYLRELPPAAFAGALVLFIILGVFLFFNDRHIYNLAAAGALLFMAAALAGYLYRRYGLIIQATPFFLVAVTGYAGSLIYSTRKAIAQKKHALDVLHREESDISALVLPHFEAGGEERVKQASFLASSEKTSSMTMRIMADAIGAEAAYLYQLEPAGGRFRKIAGWGPGQGENEELEQLVSAVAEKKKPDFGRRPKNNLGFREQDIRVRNYLVLPVLSGPRTLAVAVLVNKQPTFYSSSQQFSSADVQLAGIMSFQSLLGIQNANLNLELKNTQLDTIMRLSRAVESRDRETGEHINRITDYATIIACGLGMADHEIQLLRYAVPMHDIGKISIPDSILLKPGPLTPEERKLIETHCEAGAHILAESNSVILRTGEMIALTHHERYDGRGYPRGLKGENIPLYGRITALADVFDAICSQRCYKAAISIEEAIEFTRGESGKAFDPELVRVFLENLWQSYD